MGSLEGEQKKFKNTEDSEDESEILEESPCGRWLKRREVVSALRLNKAYYFSILFVELINKPSLLSLKSLTHLTGTTA